MSKKKYIYLSTVTICSFLALSWISVLGFPPALSIAKTLPPTTPKLYLTPVNVTTCEEIRASADKQEAEINLQILKQHEEIKYIVSAPGLVDRILKNKNIPEDKLILLAEIKKDPKALDKRTAKQLSEVKALKQQALGSCRLN